MNKSLLLVLVAVARVSFAVTLKLTPIISAGITDPTHVTVAPGEPDRIYVVEQRGRIAVIERGKLLPVPFLDIENKVTSGGEMGLLAVAFHPSYAKNHKFYVDYNESRPNLTTVISEMTPGKTPKAPAEREVLTIAQPYTNHKGGQLAFDKAGYLYIGMGDGGSGGDPHGNGQNKESLLAKILRIDVDRGKPYAIPSDNPFAKGGGRKEIFAWGLRNPWRFSFDRETGLLFAADVGQELWEEIDVVEKGGNYGWNVMEGNHCYKPAKGCDPKGLVPPVHEYGHDVGLSITGGFVYRGKKIPALRGVYIYADYGSGKIWGLSYDQKAKKALKNELLLDSNQPITSFGEDHDGELLVAIYTGVISRLEPK